MNAQIFRSCAILSLLILSFLPAFADEKEDAALKHKVEDKLLMDSRINNLFITVDVKEKKAVLSGRAVSEDDKALAEKTAKDVKGIAGVTNSLEVKPLDKDDAEKLKNLKQNTDSALKFSRKPLHAGPLYSPQPYNQRNINKMNRRLDSNIKEVFSDRDIQEKVQNAIRMAPTRGRTDNITVLVSGGRVTLIGTVECVLDQETVRDAANSVPGVTHVDDSTRLNR